MPPKTSARNSSVNEIGKPTKISPTMPTSMTMPRISFAFIGSDLALSVLDEQRSSPSGPKALHELGDALQEQQGAREWDDPPQWPKDRLPCSGIRLLVD